MKSKSTFSITDLTAAVNAVSPARPPQGLVPGGCDDLATLGYLVNSLYTVKGGSTGVQTVLCDFTKGAGSEFILLVSMIA